MRLVVLSVEDYKTELQTELSEILHAPVKIGKLRANMRGFSPELVFKEIQILSQSNAAGSGIQLQQLRLGIHLLQLLINRDFLSSSWVTLVGVKLTVKRLMDGQVSIVGIHSEDTDDPLWLLQGGRYEFLQSELTWLDEAKPDHPIHLSSVDVVLKNEADGQHHQIHGLIKLPEQYGSWLRVSAEFTGNVFKAKGVNGHLYVEGSQLQASELLTELPAGFSIDKGRTDVKLWSHWQASRLQDITGELRLSKANINGLQEKSLQIESLHSHFAWLKKKEGWQLSLKDFGLETAAKKWPAATLALSLTSFEHEKPTRISAFIDDLDVQEAVELADFFLPESNYTPWLKKGWHGHLKNCQTFIDLTVGHYAFQGGFNALGWPEMTDVPGVEGLSGYINARHDKARLWLASDKTKLSFNQWFRKPFIDHSVKGIIDFNQTGTGWDLSTPQLALTTAGLNTKTRFRIQQSDELTQPFVDVQMAYDSSDVSLAKNYFPTGIMDTDVVAWLDAAFVTGRAENGKALFYGNLQDYPFLSAQGDFQISFDTPDMDLDFDADWPNLKALNASAFFTYDSVRVKIHSGQSENLKLKPSIVTIDSFENSQYVDVKGHVSGKINSVLGYLQKTPIAYQVDPVMDAIVPSGENTVSVDVDIKVPMRQGLNAKVNGSAQLINHQLTVRSLDLPVTGINGELKFNEQGVFSEQINAEALGHPIQVKVSSQKDKTSVKVNGVMDAINLERQFQLPWLKLARGETNYVLQLDLPYKSKNSPSINLQSNLSGITLDLPEDLAKNSRQKRSFSLTFFLEEGNLLPIRLTYAKQLKAAFEVDINKQALHAGHFLIGHGQIQITGFDGIKLEINRQKIDLKQWLALASGVGKSQDLVNSIQLHAQQAIWQQKNLGVLDLALSRHKRQWQADINSVMAKGTMYIPDDLKGDDKLAMNMDYLDLAALSVLAGEGAAIQPDQFPLLSVRSKKILTGKNNWGQLVLETERDIQGIFMPQAVLTDEHNRLAFNGSWLTTGNDFKTEISGSLVSDEFGQLLTKLNISDDIKETEANINFNLSWPGAPAQVAVKNLTGQVDAELEDGRILGIEPGFGRILGFIALDQWVKRLRLDFSDLYKAGLAFNTITGRFDLSAGKAVSKNLKIDALSARIKVVGETDLVAKQFDHKVTVVPKSSEAVPIAGTIVREVAGLVAKSLTGDKQEGFFFGSQFLVKGDWDDAEIIPQHEHDGLVNKTWRGITDFLSIDQNKYKERDDE